MHSELKLDREEDGTKIDLTIDIVDGWMDLDCEAHMGVTPMSRGILLALRNMLDTLNLDVDVSEPVAVEPIREEPHSTGRYSPEAYTLIQEFIPELKGAEIAVHDDFLDRIRQNIGVARRLVDLFPEE